jgi:hypothetical protein
VFAAHAVPMMGHLDKLNKLMGKGMRMLNACTYIYNNRVCIK